MDLDSLLEILGIDLATLPQIKEEGLNLYTQFGKRPVANLLFKNGKFVLRFGDAVEPSSVCEELTTGVIRVRPLKPKLDYHND